jgi:hypothetical protein
MSILPPLNWLEAARTTNSAVSPMESETTKTIGC